MPEYNKEPPSVYIDGVKVGTVASISIDGNPIEKQMKERGELGKTQLDKVYNIHKGKEGKLPKKFRKGWS